MIIFIRNEVFSGVHMIAFNWNERSFRMKREINGPCVYMDPMGINGPSKRTQWVSLRGPFIPLFIRNEHSFRFKAIM